jgi:hypothetical protein
MKIKHLFVLLFISFAAVISAQDMIELLNGVEIKGNVIEVNDDVVKYKAWENLYAAENAKVLKASVFKIKYQDGKVVVITKSPIMLEEERLQKLAEEKKLAEAQKIVEAQKLAEARKIVEAQRIAEAQKLDEQKNAMLNQKEGENQLGLSKKIEAFKKTEAQPIKVGKKYPSVSKIRRFTGGVFGGISIPLGLYQEWKLDDYSDGSGAELGFSTGLNLGYRINAKLSVLMEGQFALHSYTLNVSDVGNSYRLNGNWYNISIFPTVRFDLPLMKKLDFYAQAGSGMTVTLPDGNLLDVFDAAEIDGFSTHFGFSGGAGLSFKGVNIGARFTGGTPSFKDYKPMIAQLSCTLGYQF